MAAGNRAQVARFSNSEIKIPATPGLGLELNEEACARHPYVRHPIRQFDPGPALTRPEGSVPFVTAADD